MGVGSIPVSIVEVMNNTGSVLHYVNTESGYKFDVNPTVPTKSGKGGTISTSRLQDEPDPVPFKSSGRRINISVDNGGPTFTVTNDLKFVVDCDAKAQEWVKPFITGVRLFVMRVDPHGMLIVAYDEGMRSGDCGFVVKGPNLAVTEDYPNAYYAMKLH